MDSKRYTFCNRWDLKSRWNYNEKSKLSTTLRDRKLGCEAWHLEFDPLGVKLRILGYICLPLVLVPLVQTSYSMTLHNYYSINKYQKLYYLYYFVFGIFWFLFRFNFALVARVSKLIFLAQRRTDGLKSRVHGGCNPLPTNAIWGL